MKIAKKMAGGAATLADLEEFLAEARKEGFELSHPLNGGKEIGLFVEIIEGTDAPKIDAESDYCGRCPECRRDDAPSSPAGVALTHYRGETKHPDTVCYGVGKKVYQLRKKSSQ